MKLSVFYEHVREAAEQTGKDIPEILSEVRKAGIGGIEMEYRVNCDNQAIYDMIVSAGLEISCIYQFFDFGKECEEGIRIARKTIDDAVRMNVKRIMPIPGFLDEEAAAQLNAVSDNYEKTSEVMRSLPEITAMKKGMTEVVAYAAERGICVTIEDFDAFNSPIARTNQIKWFIDNVPGLMHTLDMGNYVFSDESSAEAYEVFKGKIAHVHCKDRGEENETDPEIFRVLGSNLKNRRGIKPVPVGGGYMPIKELVKKLLEAGYDGYFAIEHFGSPDQLDFIKKSADFMKSIS